MSGYRVIGPFEINGKATGETVELDPEVINVQVLLDAGHIEEIRSRTRTTEVRDVK